MKTTAIIVALFLLFLGILACTYILPEGEQGVLLEFGQPVGYTTTAGLHTKAPFITHFVTLPKVQLEWDGESTEVPTGDRLLLQVTPFARWQISDLKTYYPAMHDVATGKSRLHDVLLSTMRSIIATYPLAECVRSEKDISKTPAVGMVDDATLKTELEPIEVGRKALEAKIMETANVALRPYGINILAFGIKKTGYGRSTHQFIANRMIAERTQVGKNIITAAQAEATNIESKSKADADILVATANATARETRGQAEAQAQALYRKAMEGPQALEFYNLLLQTDGLKHAFEDSAGRSTTLFIQGANPLLGKKKPE
jgi:membrane protease subunit HflC